MKHSLLFVSMLVVLSTFGITAASSWADDSTERDGNTAILENHLEQGGKDGKTTDVHDRKENTTPKADTGIRRTTGWYGDKAAEKNYKQ
ncbi:MAG: hypothetical protein HQL01_14785 [Nitrospirae bacterium]|nr:hypothetical protein [Nitrospirota bacterium]